jgi:hypothetical protein
MMLFEPSVNLVAFVVEEEERAIADLVDVRATFAEVRNRDRAADVESEVVLIVAGAVDPGRVIPKCVCVQFLVADRIVDLTVIIVAAALLREVNDAAG